MRLGIPPSLPLPTPFVILSEAKDPRFLTSPHPSPTPNSRPHPTDKVFLLLFVHKKKNLPSPYPRHHSNKKILKTPKISLHPASNTVRMPANGTASTRSGRPIGPAPRLRPGGGRLRNCVRGPARRDRGHFRPHLRPPGAASRPLAIRPTPPAHDPPHRAPSPSRTGTPPQIHPPQHPRYPPHCGHAPPQAPNPSRNMLGHRAHRRRSVPFRPAKLPTTLSPWAAAIRAFPRVKNRLCGDANPRLI